MSMQQAMDREAQRLNEDTKRRFGTQVETGYATKDNGQVVRTAKKKTGKERRAERKSKSQTEHIW
jgi:hypothetical protein